MRILYLTEVNIDVPSSVLTKMNAQIEEWSTYGHEIFVASFPIYNVQRKQILLSKEAKGFIEYKNSWVKRFPKGGLFNMGNKILSIKKYRNYISKISPDLIYLREMAAFPGLASLLHKNKVVVESNTVLMNEIKLRNKKLFQLAKLYQNKVNKKVDGFIGVTNEVTNQFIKYNKPSLTITNGIKIETFNIISPVNNRAQIIMVCSPGCLWHGFDKYIKMAELLPEMDFHLIGPPKLDFNVSFKNLFLYGYLSKIELINIYSKMDIAVGTLALHRKNMQEASPLKVREYALFGLPMILAYNDTDFTGKDFDFILQIENSEKNVENNISHITKFINKWKGKRIKIEEVDPLISISNKEKMRLDFFKTIIN